MDIKKRIKKEMDGYKNMIIRMPKNGTVAFSGRKIFMSDEDRRLLLECIERDLFSLAEDITKVYKKDVERKSDYDLWLEQQDESVQREQEMGAL